MMRKILIGFMLSFFLGGAAFAAGGTVKTSEEAMTLLREGNARFVAMKLEHPDETVERREETATKGQKPFAAVLGCADSRVPVEMIFDRGIGDIFTVRVAGNIARDNSVIGSLEYAAGHLHVPLIVVLGHTQCGAVGAAVSGEKLKGAIGRIQKKIEPVAQKVKKEHPDLQNAALIDETVKQNALQTGKDLLPMSEEIRHLVDKGSLRIVPAVYNIQTGQVVWLPNERAGSFRPKKIKGVYGRKPGSSEGRS